MASKKENRHTDLIKCIGLFLFVCGAFMLIYNYSIKARLNEENDLKIERLRKEIWKVIILLYLLYSFLLYLFINH